MPIEDNRLQGGRRITARRCVLCRQVRIMELLISRSPLSENQPYARLVLEWLTGNAPEIMQRLTGYIEACPKVIQEEAPSEKPERTRSSKRGPLPHFAGKSKLSVRDFSGTVTRIPAGVYWSSEQSNFYDCGNDKGMGQHFFDDWFGSRMIFPQHKEDACHSLNHEGVHDFRVAERERESASGV
jgi:hypothetical protein